MIMQLSLSQNQYTSSRIEDLENRLIHGVTSRNGNYRTLRVTDWA